jgi:ABC-type transport system involved in multi-copper enzyme maturation permease subunit
MVRLLKIEWLKYGKSSLLWFVLGFFAILIPGKMTSMVQVNKMPPPIPDPGSFSQLPLIWEFQAYNASWQTFFFLGFLSIFLVTSEFSNRTAKQNIIQGMTRSSFFASKLLDIIVLAFVTMIYFGGVTILIGINNTPEWSFDMLWGENMPLIRYFVMSLGYMSFGLMVAFLIRKTGPALITYFGYGLFLEVAIRYGVHSKIFPGSSQFYYPLNAMEDLAPMPLFKMIPDFMSKQELGITLLSTEAALITSLIYIFLFTGISYYSFLKRDI